MYELTDLTLGEYFLSFIIPNLKKYKIGPYSLDTYWGSKNLQRLKSLILDTSYDYIIIKKYNSEYIDYRSDYKDIKLNTITNVYWLEFIENTKFMIRNNKIEEFLI